METKYRQGGMTLAMGKPNISYVESQVVGGGSEINSGLYHRTPAVILEKWKKDFGLEASSELELETYFKRCEEILHIGYQDPSFISGAADKLRLGAIRKNWRGSQIPRWIRDGTRYSMSATFIPEALKAGCVLKQGHQVRTLKRTKAGWAVGGIENGARPFSEESKFLFLCGGAVQTPFLLKKNALSKTAGQQLQLHPSLKMVGQFEDVVSTYSADVPDYQVKEFAPQLSFGCSISSPSHLAVALGGASNLTAELAKQQAVYYAMIEDEARGKVIALPYADRAVVKYSLSKAGTELLRLGMLRLAEILFAADAKKIFLSAQGTPEITRDNLEKMSKTLRIETLRLMTIHLFASCPMGERREKTVANSFGAVHDQPGLFINDASLLCSAPSVNPQGTVMAFALRNAEAFVHSLKGSS